MNLIKLTISTRRLLFAFLAIMLISNNSFGQMEYNNNLRSFHIKGNVDSIIDDEIRVINNDSTKTKTDTRNCSYFNKKGLLTEFSTDSYWANEQFHLNDAKPLIITYTYDNKDNLMEIIYYGSDGSIGEKTTYTADPATSQIESKSYYMPNHQALITIKKLLKDKRGNIIEVSSYDPSWKLNNHRTYKYDDNNFRLENVETNVTTLTKTKTIFTYKEGDLVEEVNYDDLGGIVSTNTY